MSQIYKVFSNNLIFCVKEDCNLDDNANDCTIIDDVRSFIGLMKLSVSSNFPNDLYKKIIIFYSKEINNDWIRIVNSFNLIEASGGVVENYCDDFLFIFKNGKWDLPKGKIDNGESPENAAIREINEETSLLDLEMARFITSTYHLYQEDSIILKKTFWFLFRVHNFQKMKPQKEEGITDLKWFSRSDLPSTYNSIMHIMLKLNN